MMIKYVLIFALFLISACTPHKISLPTPDPQPDGNISLSDFLRNAVFYGLQKDAAPKALVDKALSNNLFVPKCPICRPVQAGMRKHLTQLPKVTVKRRADSVVAQLMNATTREAQQTALRNLIANYVENYYSVLKFTPEARQKMEQQLQNGRKKGMAAMREDFGKFCPSCDGACKIKMEKE